MLRRLRAGEPGRRVPRRHRRVAVSGRRLIRHVAAAAPVGFGCCTARRAPCGRACSTRARVGAVDP
eukprot:364780-Chlamydomonas_euryale.AAC.2